MLFGTQFAAKFDREIFIGRRLATAVIGNDLPSRQIPIIY